MVNGREPMRAGARYGGQSETSNGEDRMVDRESAGNQPGNDLTSKCW